MEPVCKNFVFEDSVRVGEHIFDEFYKIYPEEQIVHEIEDKQMSQFKGQGSQALEVAFGKKVRRHEE